MNASSTITDRIGALSGLGFVGLMLLFFASFNDPNPLSPDEPSSVLAAYLTRSDSRVELMTTLALMAVVCFIPFLAFLAAQIRRVEGPHGWLAAAAFGGGLIYAALLLVKTAVTLAAGIIIAYGGDTQVAKTLYVLGWDFSYVFGPPLATLIGAASVASVLHNALPRWLGWAGLLVTLVLAIPALTNFGFLLAHPWLAIVSGALLWRTIAADPIQVAAEITPVRGVGTH